MTQIDYKMPLIIDTREYINLLTRLGITLVTDIQIYLTKYSALHFTSVQQALNFSKAIVSDNYDLMLAVYNSVLLYDNSNVLNFTAEKYSIWLRVSDSIRMFFNYIKFTNSQLLKTWLINNVEIGNLIDLAEIITNENIALEKFMENQRNKTLENIVKNFCWYL